MNFSTLKCCLSGRRKSNTSITYANAHPDRKSLHSFHRTNLTQKNFFPERASRKKKINLISLHDVFPLEPSSSLSLNRFINFVYCLQLSSHCYRGLFAKFLPSTRYRSEAKVLLCCAIRKRCTIQLDSYQLVAVLAGLESLVVAIEREKDN